MAYCAHCGSLLVGEKKFCSSCGASAISLAAPHRASLPPGSELPASLPQTPRASAAGWASGPPSRADRPLAAPRSVASAAENTSALLPGASVLVQWADGNRYPGTVREVTAGAFLVAFVDGQTRWVDAAFVFLTPRGPST